MLVSRCRPMLLPWPWCDLFYSSAFTAYSGDNVISCSSHTAS